VGTGAAGICVSAMVPSLAPVSRRGVPIGPGLLYGDRRGNNDSGLPDPLGQFPAFVGWAAREHRDAAGYWPAQAVGAVALGGPPVIDSGVAGVAFPLFDGNGWDIAALTALGARADQLPTVVPTGGAAAELPGGTVLASGVVDGMADTMVAGADRAGDVLVLLGATLIVWMIGTEWSQVEGMMTLPHGDQGLWSCGGPSNAGGLFIDWVHRLIGTGAAARGDGPTDSVPVWLPYLRGERAPYHDSSRRAALDGLHSGHDAAALRRAAYEASGFVVRHLIELSGINARRVVATGGGVRLAPWVQAVADATGLPVDVVAVPEGAALGAAFIARVAAGLGDTLADAGRWARRSHTIEPDPAVVEPAADRYRRFLALSG
jgi:xylulokinase